jgi:hypothetical protein
MMKRTVLKKGLNLLLVGGLLVTAATPDGKAQSSYSFSGDAAMVSKYIWRGQRLTNDWSLQPSMTMGVGGFSFNVWGNLDLTAVNEGDSLFLRENPLAPAGDHAGLKGKFSEVDYTFSYAHSFEEVSIDVGTIFYTFPERSASLASTTEIYGSVSLDAVPLAPSATLYIDVDETGASGDTGIYFLLAAGHSLPFAHNVFSGLDLSASLAFVNGGFGQFYYGADEAGTHDVSLTLSLPITLGESVSASAFLTYSGLIGSFRDYQFQDPRDLLLGTAQSPSDLADTVWGGLTLSLGF